MPCNCGIGILFVFSLALWPNIPLGRGHPRIQPRGYMVCSPIKRVAFACAFLTLRVVGLSFGFYLLPNHTSDLEEKSPSPTPVPWLHLRRPGSRRSQGAPRSCGDLQPFSWLGDFHPKWYSRSFMADFPNMMIVI